MKSTFKDNFIILISYFSIFKIFLKNNFYMVKDKIRWDKIR